MTTKRTPGPWHIAEDNYDFKLLPLFITPAGTHDTRFSIARVDMANYHPDDLFEAKQEARANAAFIVEACNAYDGLRAERDAAVALLRGFHEWYAAIKEPGLIPRGELVSQRLRESRAFLARFDGASNEPA